MLFRMQILCFAENHMMATVSPRRSKRQAKPLPPLPVSAAHLAAVIEHLRLSAQQGRVLDLALRGLGIKQIGSELSLSEPTVKTYLDRVAARVGIRGRVPLLLHIVALAFTLHDD